MPRPRATRIATRVGPLRVSLWQPAGTGRDAELPLLVVHDGPEYARKARLLRLLEDAPPVRAALVAPAVRDEHYSASARYARALAEDLLPALPDAPRRVGLGCSLGALALLHCHVRHPGAFDRLVLQSGSFFRRRTDRQESGFPRFGRIARFVGGVLRGDGSDRPVPVTITCGIEEENLENNRAVARALAAAGYPVRFREVPGGHDWPSWRRALEDELPEAIA